ncbi:unnamed protein product [Effrenium voratum]|uniref:Uncharacterized protein n=1 Tax=Effrenium voratum TaxID=2562239 RepID=A0AA36MK38_9DINO|nr:unnamed protein product [Effrenium voratum]
MKESDEERPLAKRSRRMVRRLSGIGGIGGRAVESSSSSFFSAVMPSQEAMEVAGEEKEDEAKQDEDEDAKVASQMDRCFGEPELCLCKVWGRKGEPPRRCKGKAKQSLCCARHAHSKNAVSWFDEVRVAWAVLRADLQNDAFAVAAERAFRKHPEADKDGRVPCRSFPVRRHGWAGALQKALRYIQGEPLGAGQAGLGVLAKLWAGGRSEGELG